MSRFEEANDRLLSALDRLERIAKQRAQKAVEGEAVDGQAGDGAAGADEELASLREALEASRRTNASLRSSRDEVAQRLDGAIERLTTVLGE